MLALGQWLVGGPGTQQPRLRLCRSLGGIAARLLLELHGVEHEQQGGDEGDRVDGPELVFQRDIAKPGTHGRFSLIAETALARCHYCAAIESTGFDMGQWAASIRHRQSKKGP